MKKNNKITKILQLVIAFIICTFSFTILYYNTKDEFEIKDATYLEFKSMANNGEIESATIQDGETTFEFKTKSGQTYVTENPNYDSFKFDMMEYGIQVKEVQAMNTSSLISILINVGFCVIMGYVLYSMIRQQSGNMNKKMIHPEKDEREDINIDLEGKKKVNKRRTTFQDVAGLKQVKNDMVTLVDFLKNPNKYVEAGAKLPKGVILYGPPGTGKTLLAKAIAGEAGVPFFNMAGSDFVEMFVGMGARRVRELFAEARKNAPCIIFIDELDAIGNSRSNLSSGNTEHRQTINALLAEMDGFNGAEGILVIGATNRLEDLDNALIRPGRFDKHISIPLPETAEERLEIINLYTKNKSFSEDVDFNVLAKETIGFSPADIEALLNEAVLISVQKDRKYVNSDDIDDAIYKKLLKGHAKEDAKRDNDEIKLVAWHEAGHAVIGKLCNMDVSKVTIIPSTSGTGGVNIIIPKKMGLYSIEELKNNVKMSYGGRCAEYLLYGDWNKTTTGASADIKQATSTIYNMISMYGMTEEYGMLNLNELNIDNKEILQKAVQMSKELMAETFEMLKENRDMHQAIVNVLLEKETISGKELDEIYNKYKKEKTNVSQKKEDIFDKDTIKGFVLEENSEKVIETSETPSESIILEEIDSESEYKKLADELGGSNILLTPGSKEYINTFDISEEILELEKKETEKILLEDDKGVEEKILTDTFLIKETISEPKVTISSEILTKNNITAENIILDKTSENNIHETCKNEMNKNDLQSNKEIKTTIKTNESQNVIIEIASNNQKRKHRRKRRHKK